MKWLLYVIAAIVFAGVFVSIIGIVADADHLAFWTQTLMLSLLGTVIVAPALVYVAARSKAETNEPIATPSVPAETTGRSATNGAPRPKRSAFRIGAYVFSGFVVVWAAVSLISLFVDQARLSFWTQSVMWSLLVLLIWAPVMAFFINPFNDPAIQDTTSGRSHGDETTGDFVPEGSTTFATGPNVTEERETPSGDAPSSRATGHPEREAAQNHPEEASR
ncbi:hypothetical protein CRI94_02730 [Longibacter salinarum]|uniref:Uncharacterized protein n=1 Tax=Longibacter salinarum TaxID=1850348 RepID=A0A2A8D341_9BACT|nr:hypothetical protein [Longibacter salinarum]PEN15213.1 hypothetical protein CRI94_02730 [Longibacter salinarum]